jgi:hypothetical protein
MIGARLGLYEATARIGAGGWARFTAPTTLARSAMWP